MMRTGAHANSLEIENMCTGVHADNFKIVNMYTGVHIYNNVYTSTHLFF
jgi:hypothetical protein